MQKKRTFVLCHCGRWIQRRVGPGGRAPYSGRALFRSSSRHGRVCECVGVWCWCCDDRSGEWMGLEDGSVMAGDDAGGFSARRTSSTRSNAMNPRREYTMSQPGAVRGQQSLQMMPVYYYYVWLDGLRGRPQSTGRGEGGSKKKR
jgi:hypothetical protein